MKKAIVFFVPVFLFACLLEATAQIDTARLKREQQKIIEQYKKMGIKIDPENTTEKNDSNFPLPQAPFTFQTIPEYTFTNEPGMKMDYSLFGSGRNEAQRRTALLAVEAELAAKPLLLPLPQSIPTRQYMLGMAEARYKAARQKFKPADASQFSSLVNWIPQFDDTHTDSVKASGYSFAVAVSTNHNPYPYFNIALACVVFALHPDHPVQANNLASAILSGGELICEKTPTKEALALYRRDAESAFLYAITRSMKNGQWSEASLVPVINLGNLCIDLGRLEEARSLFMVARKIKPESWDAAKGLAAYFFALNQKDKALAILEDENLDLPPKYLLVAKSKKSLQKSDAFTKLPPESPYEQYEEGIRIMSEEPVLTAADFILQLDQEERNKMRYFIENLPEKGSFAAPSIKKLTQYASLKAISSPQGLSAVADFNEMLGVYSLRVSAQFSVQQMEWLEKFGLKINVSGVDLNDMIKHPEKYFDKNQDPNVKVTGMEEFLKRMKEMEKDAATANKQLKEGNPQGITKIASEIDKMNGILLIDPEDYADPMNVIIQKMNYVVYLRKTALHKGYLQSLTRKTFRQVKEIIEQTTRKMTDLGKIADAEMKQYEKEREEAKKRADQGGNPFDEVEWDIKRHKLHEKFFNASNNIQETGFGSATNVISVIYLNKIKPAAEAYYYDVFRHIALISDPEVRDQKAADLTGALYGFISYALQTVLMAHTSFAYSDDWDCSCSLEELLAAREAEEREKEEEETARIERNKNAKAVFESGEVPESSPLFKKLDAYVDEYNFVLLKARVSCARTTIEVNTEWITNTLKFPPGFTASFNYKSTESEFTGAITRNGGVKLGVESKITDHAKATTNLNLSFSVSSDGAGVVKDYSVTAGASAGVSVGGYSMSTGVSGTVQGNQGGIQNYSLTQNVNVTVKYGQTTISGGASITGGSKGFESDFSSKVTQDFKNGAGTDGNVTFDASTKRGCSLSGKVEQAINPAGVQVQKEAVDKVKKESGLNLNTDFHKKTLWSGKFDFKKKEATFTK